MLVDRLAHSQSKYTKRKTEILEKLAKKLFNAHNQSYPDEGFGIIDTYGGPYHYKEDGSSFIGSPGVFTKLANEMLTEFRYITYEREKERSVVLQEELAVYGKQAIVFPKSNEDCYWELPSKLPYNQGLIFVDPDGEFKMEWLLNLHKRFPNYTLILHFNNTTIKRKRARMIKRGRPYDSLMSKLCQLPPWPKYISAPTPGWHWTMIVQTAKAIDLSSLKPLLVPLKSKKGIEYLSDAALSDNEVIKGVDIFNPMFKAPNLVDILSLI